METVFSWAISMISRSRLQQARHDLAGGLCLGSGAYLLMVPAALALAWVVAALQGVVPWGAWGVCHGMRGPWHSAPILVNLLMAAMFFLPLLAIGHALAAFALRPSWRALALTVAGAATLVGMVRTFCWLID